MKFISLIIILVLFWVNSLINTEKEYCFTKNDIIEDSEISFTEYPNGTVELIKNDRTIKLSRIKYLINCKQGEIKVYEIFFEHQKNTENINSIEFASLKKYLKLWNGILSNNVWSLKSLDAEFLIKSKPDEVYKYLDFDKYSLAKFEDYNKYDFSFRIKRKKHKYELDVSFSIIKNNGYRKILEKINKFIGRKIKKL